MSLCTDCGDLVPVHIAVKTGLCSPGDAGSARNDVHGYNAFCKCEGFINTATREDDGCLAFQCKAKH